MSDNKKIWAAHCVQHYVPLYFQPWWMDCVCGEQNWDVLLSLDGGSSVEGALLYHYGRYFGLPVIKMPMLTAYSGLWICPTDPAKSPSGRMAFEKRLCENLIAQLPRHVFFYQQWHPRITNWLPFYWKNFRQTTHYTYVIDGGVERDLCTHASLNRKARRGIRKSEHALRVEQTEDVELAFRLHKASRNRQQNEPGFSFDLLVRLDNALKTMNQRTILAVKDESGTVHAIAYLVWDERTTYDLFNGTAPAHRKSNSTYLLIWDALKNNYGRSQFFDFEGSMVEPVEEFLRSFGGQLTPHFRVFKASNRLVRLASVLFSNEY
jgi:hypothetical protein